MAQPTAQTDRDLTSISEARSLARRAKAAAPALAELSQEQIDAIVDATDGAIKALDCAVSVCSALGASLTALAVEGKLPAYAASLGEVDEVVREKTEFFTRVLQGRKSCSGAARGRRAH